MVKFPEKYIVAGVDSTDETTVFIGEDHASGGYLYWSTYYGAAKTYPKIDVKELLEKNSYLSDTIKNVKLYRIKFEEV